MKKIPRTTIKQCLGCPYQKQDDRIFWCTYTNPVHYVNIGDVKNSFPSWCPLEDEEPEKAEKNPNRWATGTIPNGFYDNTRTLEREQYKDGSLCWSISFGELARRVLRDKESILIPWGGFPDIPRVSGKRDAVPEKAENPDVEAMRAAWDALHAVAVNGTGYEYLRSFFFSGWEAREGQTPTHDRSMVEEIKKRIKELQAIARTGGKSNFDRVTAFGSSLTCISKIEEENR